MTLDAWRDGATRDALLRFLDAAESVPVEDRVAVLDNDGTLWCERPTYIQFDFFVWELRLRSEQTPSLRERPEYASVLAGGMAAVGEFGLERVAYALTELFAGFTAEAFRSRVREFFATAQQPGSGRTYASLRYGPMLELLEALRGREFSVFIVSGGGMDFVRAVSGALYGIRPEAVIGTGVSYDLERLDGKPLLRRTAALHGPPNEGEAKVERIQYHVGRRPIFAAGNSAGDLDMLDFALAGDGPSLGLLVDHDDAAREYAYESVAATLSIEGAIAEYGRRAGWTIASMRDDWRDVFADGAAGPEGR